MQLMLLNAVETEKHPSLLPGCQQTGFEKRLMVYYVDSPGSYSRQTPYR